MYSLWDYCRMIEDPVRTDAYLAALRREQTELKDFLLGLQGLFLRISWH